MSLQNTAEDNFLKIIFQAVAWANLADNAASAPLTNLYVSLHTADPGEAGSQTTNETAYTSYARVAVARTSGGWAVSSGVGSNVGSITFPTCTGGTSTVTHFGIGSASSGAGVLYISGALSASLAVSNTIAPFFAASQLTITVD